MNHKFINTYPVIPARIKQAPVVKIHIQRNDKCYCGSGKKYKHCHLLKHS